MGRYDHVEKGTNHEFQIAVMLRATVTNDQVFGVKGRMLNIMNK